MGSIMSADGISKKDSENRTQQEKKVLDYYTHYWQRIEKGKMMIEAVKM